MHELKELILNRITAGLARKSIRKCSEWAERYRVLGGGSFPGPWRFARFPWLRDMADSDAEMNIGQKGAQLGFTDNVLNRVLFNIDVKNYDVLYILPSWKPDASDFSSGRFNPAIEFSSHLKDIFSDVANIGHKRAGSANLYIRGSRAKSQLKSIPVNQIVIDEKDEMIQAHVPLALERMSGQVDREAWQISTPTFPDYGINADYENSSQNHYFFKCPRCSRATELIFPDCLVVTAEKLTDPTLKDSHIICKECKGILTHETKSEWMSLANSYWVETYSQRDMKGWHVNQLYSPALPPFKIAETVIKAQLDPAAEQELHNSKMGLPHIVKGAGVTDQNIRDSIRDYRILDSYSGNRVVTMGVDVGWPVCHIEIDEWILGKETNPEINLIAKPRVIYMGTKTSFDDLLKLFQDFRVNFCVIDSQPERRMALEFANKLLGKVRCCSYEMGIEGKQIHIVKEEPRIKVDRTSWLDLSLGRFKQPDSIYLPADTSEEYKKHIKNQIRVYQKDKNGNQTGRYITPQGEDHFGHARNYAEIALPLAASLRANVDIKGQIL